jgi:ribosome-binding factor A
VARSRDHDGPGRHRLGGSGRRSGRDVTRRYPRSARVNEILREVLADEISRISDQDDRLGLLTVTGVVCEPDLRHAVVLLSSLGPDAEEALGSARVRLQSAVSTQVRLKRTPQLRFAADPAVAAGTRIDDILRHLPPPSDSDEPDERPDRDGRDDRGGRDEPRDDRAGPGDGPIAP